MTAHDTTDPRGPEAGSPSAEPRPATGTRSEPEAQQRDAQALGAFERFYGLHRRHVVAYCRRRAEGPDALEVADETFLVAWRRWDEIPGRGERHRARAWLYGVAYRLLGNQRRGQRRRRALTTRIAGRRPTRRDHPPETAVLRTEEHREVLSALATLPDRDQEVLRLSAWEELSHPEIATVLGITTDAVAQRAHRARRRLALALDGSAARTPEEEPS